MTIVEDHVRHPQRQVDGVSLLYGEGVETGHDGALPFEDVVDLLFVVMLVVVGGMAFADCLAGEIPERQQTGLVGDRLVCREAFQKLPGDRLAMISHVR